MKAVVCTRYGPPEDVLEIREVQKPAPAPNEILVRNRATTVNSGDVRIRALKVPAGMSLLVRLANGWSRPRQPVFGFELAGIVEAVGAGVTAFRPGDRVVGSPGFALGCHAEYRCLAADGGVARIPDGIGYEDAAALCFGGVTALYFLGKAGVAPGHTLLVNGAAGAVGVMAVQVAKVMGATVTAVTSGKNAELLASLGADHVVDYHQTDFTVTGHTYDHVMDTVGNAPYARSRRVLKPDGRFLQVIGNLGEMIAGKFTRPVVSQDAPAAELFAPGSYRRLMQLAETGAIRAVIDRTYPFADIAQAHAYVDSGRKRGAVLVTLGRP